MRRSRIIVFAVVAFTLVAAACGLDQGGVVGLGESPDGSIIADGATDGAQTSPDGSTPPSDASTKDAGDASVVDSGYDAGPTTTYLCGGAQVTSCATDCPLAPHDCPSSKSCVASCFSGGGCAGNNFECDACGSDGGVALSRCEPEDASAYAECLSGLNRCACPSNVSQCPGTNQTCESNQCFECAEPDAGVGQIGDKCEKGPSNTCHADGTCQ